MKRIASILSAALVAGLLFNGCNNAANTTVVPDTQADTVAAAGSIVFFNIDKVIENFDMAHELNSSLETKVNSIREEIQRRENRLQKDANDLQDKMNKGMLTSTDYNVRLQKLQKQQNEGLQYVESKDKEISEEQSVVHNKIMNAISEYVQKYNEEKHFAMILTTTSQILLSPAIVAPVVTANPNLDITDEILAGLNAEYVKTKEAETK